MLKIFFDYNIIIFYDLRLKLIRLQMIEYLVVRLGTLYK